MGEGWGYGNGKGEGFSIGEGGEGDSEIALTEGRLREEALPIPLLRPFDPASASEDLRQGERNSLPLGMGRPYFVSRLRCGNDGYAKVSSRERG